MSDGLDFRRAAAREIARSAGLLNRLRDNRQTLRLVLSRLKDVARAYPQSFALSLAIVDAEEALEHLDHVIRALEANSRE